jgi:von Willebrand factor type A domain
MAEFTLECFQNQYLPRGAAVLHSVVDVIASGTGSEGATAAEDAEVRSELLILDVSGSMNGKKLRAAKEATAAAVDCIPDGVRFGIIVGNHEATVLYPLTRPLALSSPATRSEAKEHLKTLEAGGGTAMGTWVRLAAEVFGDAPGIRHAILLTDGKNESEASIALEWALADVEGSFGCDCRGVGEAWEVAELRKIATALLGTVDIVAQPEGLRADFTTMMQDSLRKQVADVTLRVWVPTGAEVVSLKQMEPPLDLTASRADVDVRTGDYPTGSWGDEEREYHLSVRLRPGEVDQERLAARVTLLVGQEPVGQALVKVEWTDDTHLSTRINNKVAAALGETEMADAIQDGVDALRDGEDSRATDRLGKALNMARVAGKQEVVDRLHLLVDEDPVTGRVRPKRHVEEVDLMLNEARSTRTSRSPAGPQSGAT